MTPNKRAIVLGGKTRWQLDYGLDQATGKRPRRLFDTEAEADKEIEKCRKLEKAGGEFWMRMSQAERDVVVATLQDMKTKGHAIADVWSQFQLHKKEVSSQATTSPMPYSEVVEEFRRQKTEAGDSVRYVKNTCTFLHKFGEGREKQNIHEISVMKLDKWLSKMSTDNAWSLRTRDSYQNLLASLWSVAVKNGWAALNIVDRLQDIKLPGVEIKVYKNSESLNIMAAVLSDPAKQQIIAPMALGLFGCMRPEEVESKRARTEGMPAEKFFGWHDIDLKAGLVTVRVEVAKTGDQRTIRLQPAAIAWLKLAKELKNPLPPVNERRLVDQCCALIGLDEWIRDGLRKNCATHLRAVYKNDYDAVKDCGNSTRILLKHYAALHIPERVSLDHWKLTPARVREYMESKEWENVLTAASIKKVKAAEVSQAP